MDIYGVSGSLLVARSHRRSVTPVSLLLQIPVIVVSRPSQASSSTCSDTVDGELSWKDHWHSCSWLALYVLHTTTHCRTDLEEAFIDRVQDFMVWSLD